MNDDKENIESVLSNTQFKKNTPEEENESLKQRIKKLEMEISTLKNEVDQLKGNKKYYNHNHYNNNNNENKSPMGMKFEKKNNTKNSESKNVIFKSHSEVLSQLPYEYNNTTTETTFDKTSQLRQSRMSTPHPVSRTGHFVVRNQMLLDNEKTPSDINALRNVLTPVVVEDFMHQSNERMEIDNDEPFHLSANENKNEEITVGNIVQSLDSVMAKMFHALPERQVYE